MPEKKRIAVIGAGPAGLTAAYCLIKKGFDVDVFEADSQVGGMCKTIELWGCKVDIGPHRFFSSDRQVNELWLEVAGKDYEMVSRLTRIYYKSRFFLYPLKPLNAFVNLGPLETIRCLLSYSKQILRPTPVKNDFESWVTSRYGKRLFSIFFKNYSEKLWGLPCTNLDSDFATQRIKKLSLFEAVKNAFFGGGGHKTLVDEFAYPREGTGMIYNRMAEKITAGGGSIHLKRPIKKILVKDNTAHGVETFSGDQIQYDEIISTMPLTLMVTQLDDVPAFIRDNIDKLKFRNTIIVYLKVEGVELFPDNWLYVHSPDIKTGRITNFRNWTSHLYGQTDYSIIALEYWCNDEDSLWKMEDSELIKIAKEDLVNTGLAGGRAMSEGKVLRIPRCYPVYEKGYKDILRPVQEYLNQIKNLYPIGRYGTFKYNNQDHSILMGIMVSNIITNDEKLDLWSVNTDYENYQERSVITKSGLNV